MRVKLCNQCPYKKEMRWTSSYQPANYHMIGMTHRYAYCLSAKKKCIDVLKSECRLMKKEVDNETP